MVSAMAEQDRPPTYEELIALRNSLQAENQALRSRANRLRSERDRLRGEQVPGPKKKPARKLDAGAESALDRPWDGR